MNRIGLVYLLFCVSLVACTGEKAKLAQKQTLTGFGIGTTYTVSYFNEYELVQAFQIDSVIAVYNAVFSNYDTTSEVMLLNASPRGRRVSPALKDVFLRSQRVYQLSDGAFDPSISPLVEIWGFGKSRKPQHAVAPAVVDSALQFVGLDKWKWAAEDSLTKLPQASLNFSAIAKGYIVDRVADFLKSKGVTAAMVEIGGEVVAYGTKPDNSAWAIGINNPKEVSKIYGALRLHNKALATSGNYRNFYELDGKKYAHTINPHTGYYVEHQLLSASVVANDCATADAFATAFMVMGLEKSKAFLQLGNDLEVYFIYESNGELKEWYTPGYKKLML